MPDKSILTLLINIFMKRKVVVIYSYPIRTMTKIIEVTKLNKVTIVYRTQTIIHLKLSIMHCVIALTNTLYEKTELNVFESFL